MKKSKYTGTKIGDESSVLQIGDPDPWSVNSEWLNGFGWSSPGPQG